MAVRLMHVILALWLVASAFDGPRSHASFVNALVVGALAAVLALAEAFAGRAARLAGVAVSAWLLVSSVVLPHASALTRWNDAFIALGLLALSLVPVEAPPRRRLASV